MIILQLNDIWEFHVDNNFAAIALNKIAASAPGFRRTGPNERCAKCDGLKFSTPHFRIVDEWKDLEDSRHICDFCRMRWEICRHLDREEFHTLRFERDQSMLTLNGAYPPVLSIRRSLGGSRDVGIIDGNQITMKLQRPKRVEQVISKSDIHSPSMAGARHTLSSSGTVSTTAILIILNAGLSNMGPYLQGSFLLAPRTRPTLPFTQLNAKTRLNMLPCLIRGAKGHISVRPRETLSRTGRGLTSTVFLSCSSTPLSLRGSLDWSTSGSTPSASFKDQTEILTQRLNAWKTSSAQHSALSRQAAPTDKTMASWIDRFGILDA